MNNEIFSSYLIYRQFSKNFIGNSVRTKKINVTRELGEDAPKKSQVARYIFCHCRRKRFDKGVDTEYILKKLHFHKRMMVSVK